MRYSPILTTLLGTLFLLPAAASAQMFKPRRAAPGEVRPKVLLVELFTRREKINYLLAGKNPKMAKEVQADVDIVIQKTVGDFTHNFSFCPVYFFIDSNADMIRAGRYAGVVLNDKLEPVDQPVIADGDTAIYILTFGNYVPQPATNRPQYTESNNLGGNREHNGDETTALAPTVLVMDHHFQILSETKPRTFFGRYGYVLDRAYKYNGRYHTYRPYAEAYDRTLHTYFSRAKQP